MEIYRSGSVYEVPVTLTDADTGDPIQLDTAQVRYVIADSRGGEALVEVTEADSEVTITDASAGELEIRIPASDMSAVTGSVYEELRVTTDSLDSVVVITRETRFESVRTDPP